MKLALCLFNYFPYGGLQRNFLAIAQQLLQRGHDVTVYTRSWDGPKPESLNVVLLTVRRYTNHGKNYKFHRELQKALANNPVDLVIGFNKIPDLDVYYCADTCFASKAYEEKNWLYRLTPRSRRSLKFEAAVFGREQQTEVLLLSHKEGEAFHRFYGTPWERMYLVPPGINITRIRDEHSQAKADKVRDELGMSSRQQLVTYIGTGYRRKGVDRLISAVAALPESMRANIQVIIVGKDKRQSIYEQQARRLGVAESIRFLGERDDVDELLFASNLLVHPAYTENTGNVLLEAAVAGVPVLCTERCGYAFYISEHQLGDVIPEPFQQVVMNQKLQALLNSDVNWQERCAQFASQADIYSRPLRIAERIEAIGRKRGVMA